MGRDLAGISPLGQHDSLRAPALGESWLQHDVARIVRGLQDGSLLVSPPTVLEREDGRALLYRGKVNGIHADSGAGKTMVALCAAVQEISRGEHVVFLDYEDSPVGVIGRLLALGARPDAVGELFHYVRPDEAFVYAENEFLAHIEALKPSLVVIDSTGESISVEGLQPNSDEDVAAWFRRLPRRLARAGAAVLVLDHMPKVSSGDLWPIGSQRKRAAIDGAQYVLEVKEPFSKSVAGLATLRLAKDRSGEFTHGQRVADVVVTPEDGRVDILLRGPSEAPRVSADAVRLDSMERFSRALGLSEERWIWGWPDRKER